MILTTVYTLIAVLMQCSVFPHLRFFGAIPEITLCVIVCVSLWEDEKFCCILAVAAGFVLDAVGADSFTLSPVFFLAAACVSIILSKNVFSGKVIPALISGAAALTAGAVKTSLILVGKGAVLQSVMLKTALPQFLYGALILVFVFLFFKLHFRVFKNSFENVKRGRGGARI